MRLLQSIALVVLAVSSTACATSTSRVFNECHFQITLPVGWVATKSPTACKFFVDPNDWDQIRERSETEMPDHAMILDIHHAGLEEALGIAGLERADDGSWFFDGRQRSTAEACSTKYETGQCITKYYGIFSKGGAGYQGLGETEVTILSNGQYSALITDDRGSSEVTDSFRFR